MKWQWEAKAGKYVMWFRLGQSGKASQRWWLFVVPSWKKVNQSDSKSKKFWGVLCFGGMMKSSVWVEIRVFMFGNTEKRVWEVLNRQISKGLARMVRQRVRFSTYPAGHGSCQTGQIQKVLVSEGKKELWAQAKHHHKMSLVPSVGERHGPLSFCVDRGCILGKEVYLDVLEQTWVSLVSVSGEVQSKHRNGL